MANHRWTSAASEQTRRRPRPGGLFNEGSQMGLPPERCERPPRSSLPCSSPAARQRLFRLGALQPPAPLDVDVAVDERDRELRGLDVETDRAAALEAAEREPPALEIVRGGGVRERALEGVDAGRERPRQDALAQAREQHEVPRLQQAKGGLEGVVVLVAEVRQDRDERAFPQPLHELERGAVVVGGLERRLQVVAAVQDEIHRRRRLARREPARLRRQREKPHRVPLPQADVGEQQSGVQHVVEVRELVVLGAHPPAAVDQEHDLLIALVLVLARDQPAHARRRLPVDAPLTVALAVLAELVKVEPLAAAPTLEHAELREAVVGGEKRELRERGEVGIDARRGRLAEPAPYLPETGPRREPRFDSAEGDRAPPYGPQAVADLRPAARGHGHPLREAMH